MINSNADSNRHTTVTMMYQGEAIEIDGALAPLIEEIWKAGIDTMMSCEDVGDEEAWIEFDSMQDLLKFLNLIVHYEHGPDSIYNRVAQELTGGVKPFWNYQINPLAIYDPEAPQFDGEPVHLEATVGVYFPIADITEVLQRIRQANTVRVSQLD